MNGERRMNKKQEIDWAVWIKILRGSGGKGGYKSAQTMNLKTILRLLK